MGGGGVTRGSTTVDNQPENKRGVAKGSSMTKDRGGLAMRGSLATRNGEETRDGKVMRGGKATRGGEEARW